VLPLQTVPGIPELFIIAMLGAMVVGAVFLGRKLIQSLREFREGYNQS
jgi:Sec-independent protein translocase protein TatA